MQCFSCGFHAMPGSATCARCGANLSLATRPLAIDPPRAGRLARSVLPTWWAVQRRIAPLLWRLGSHEGKAEVLAFPMEAAVRPLIAMVARPTCVIPGFPLLGGSSRPLGWAVLLGWPVFLLAAVLFHGAPLVAPFLLGSALVLHAASVTSASGLGFRTANTRLAAMVTCGSVLAFVLYLPVAWTGMRLLGGSWWLTPVRVPRTAPPFDEGDLLWMERGVGLAPGDVVVVGGGPTTLRRIRALAGQEVANERGVLMVDGVPSPWQSATRPLADGTRFTVPAGRCFVLPPESHEPQEQPPAAATRRLGAPELRPATVREGQIEGWLPFAATIEGRIVWRSYPVARFGRVE